MTALARAIPYLCNGRILAVVVFPLVGSAMLWVAIGFFAWYPLTHRLGVALLGGDGGWSLFGAGLVVALLLMLAAVLTALVVVALVAMPVIVDTVAARDFPALEKRHGGTFAGSVGNAAVTIGLFLPLWLLCLMLLGLPPLYVAVSLMLNAWLNARLFRYDALALHADRSELPHVIRGARGRLLMLGFILSPLSLIPIVNLFAPVFAGIAFTQLCLAELAAYRAGVPSAVTIIRN